MEKVAWKLEDRLDGVKSTAFSREVGGDDAVSGLTAQQLRRAKMDEAAGLSLDVVAYAAPQEHLAVNAAEGRGQPWTILASTSTRGIARSSSSPMGVR
jgi:hypothetical protein